MADYQGKENSELRTQTRRLRQQFISIVGQTELPGRMSSKPNHETVFIGHN